MDDIQYDEAQMKATASLMNALDCVAESINGLAGLYVESITFTTEDWAVNIGLQLTAEGAPTPQAWTSLALVCNTVMCSDGGFELELYNATDIVEADFKEIPVTTIVDGKTHVRAEDYPYPSGMLFELSDNQPPNPVKIQIFGLAIRGEEEEGEGC